MKSSNDRIHQITIKAQLKEVTVLSLVFAWNSGSRLDPCGAAGSVCADVLLLHRVCIMLALHSAPIFCCLLKIYYTTVTVTVTFPAYTFHQTLPPSSQVIHYSSKQNFTLSLFLVLIIKQ